jgi:CO/xanthine dehydrogenase Mo-binding subunit
MTVDFSRRSFLSSAGALTVYVVSPALASAQESGPGTGPLVAQRPALKPDELSSYISIGGDGRAIAYLGKMDCGQGTDIGVLQMVAEELDLTPEQVSIVLADTAETVNQGGGTGSSGVEIGGIALRHAAAQARKVLLTMAAQKLGAPVDQLTVEKGVIRNKADPSQTVSYKDLIGGQFFDVRLHWNGILGHSLMVTGDAKPKNPKDYSVVGTTVPRRDVAGRMLGTSKMIVDVKVPGMVHGRMIRPPVAGAVPVSVDQSAIKDIPGVQLVRVKDLIGVTAPREWDAIRAARQLKVTWSQADPKFPTNEGVYDALRKAPVVKRGVTMNQGDVDGAFAKAAKVVQASYEWPFQSHASMAPACAIVDYRPEGGTTVWTGSQKPHYARDGAAAILGLKPEDVHGIYFPGPGSYGRNDAGDAVADAAVMSKAIGKPVRVQYMRHEGTGWDPKGPASVHSARAAIDANGDVVGWDFESKGFSRLDVDSNESKPRDTLAGQLLGAALKPEAAFGEPQESYGFPAKRKAWATVPPLLDRASPLRSTHLRDPVGPQIHFASESFVDEVAYSLGMDPVAFRLKYIRDPRDLAVVRAAADKANWRTRTKPGRNVSGNVAQGQGIAYVHRDATKVAIVADVEVDLNTGKVRPIRYTVAHDAGQIINPGLLRHTIEGNVIQATSRALLEEVRFDRNNVTSVDWRTYPILDIKDAPDAIDIVLIDHPELPPTGAGEASSRPIAAALANAVFDATGVRIRQAPLTPERLKKAGVA